MNIPRYKITYPESVEQSEDGQWLKLDDVLQALLSGHGHPIAEVSQAHFGPNDVLVLTFPGCISTSTAQRLKSYLEEVWPGRKSVVMGDGLKLSVLHQMPPDPAP